MAARHVGNCPGNVSKDAKYVVAYGKNGMQVRILHRVGGGEQKLWTSAPHRELVEMVNRVKRAFGSPGGSFYINEYQQVVVPVGAGGPECYLAGEYHEYLQFEFEGGLIGPESPDGLSAGASWSGHRVGIPYTLAADGRDIRYMAWTSPDRQVARRLSEEVGTSEAGRLAQRLSRFKPGGGRVYINEAREFFAPVGNGDQSVYTYLGGLDDDSWFAVPTEKRT